MVEIGSLLIGDQPEVWASLGFTMDGGDCHVSGVRHQLGGELKGVRAWGLRGVEGTDPVDGLPSDLAVADAAPTPDHANGVVSLDHVVLMTPDLGRTIDRLEAIGLDLRRTRDAGTYGAPMRQAFFRMGPVILEVVGPPEPTGDQSARFFGLAYTVRDLDETAAHLGDRLRAAKDAVQPGRRIATLDKAAGSTVAIAFMSPGEAEGS